MARPTIKGRGPNRKTALENGVKHCNEILKSVSADMLKDSAAINKAATKAGRKKAAADNA